MTEFWDVRCSHRSDYRPGTCDVLFFRVSSTGGIQVKCRGCGQFSMIHRSELDKYQTERDLEWSHYG